MATQPPLLHSLKGLWIEVVQREETLKLVATINAHKEADVNNITLVQRKAEKQIAQQIEALEDKIHAAHQQTLADAQFYTASKQSEVNKLKLSQAFLQLEAARVLAATSKTYYGSEAPHLGIADKVIEAST